MWTRSPPGARARAGGSCKDRATAGMRAGPGPMRVTGTSGNRGDPEHPQRPGASELAGGLAGRVTGRDRPGGPPGRRLPDGSRRSGPCDGISKVPTPKGVQHRMATLDRRTRPGARRAADPRSGVVPRRCCRPRSPWCCWPGGSPAGSARPAHRTPPAGTWCAGWSARWRVLRRPGRAGRRRAGTPAPCHRDPGGAGPPSEAPELHRLIRELADRLGGAGPGRDRADAGLRQLAGGGDRSAEPRSRLATPGHPLPATGAGRPAGRVLVIGSPFLWWMRAGRAAGAARARWWPAPRPPPIRRSPPPAASSAGWTPRSARAAGRPVARLLDRITARAAARPAARTSAELERAVAAAASEQAKAVDYGLRIAAQGQVGLAYAGWDRLLTRVALPAWRLGRCPAQLNAGVVAALTELSRRDRLAEGYESRLGDRPACDLLEEPGGMDAAVSLLAAELFHGPVPRRPGRPATGRTTPSRWWTAAGGCRRRPCRRRWTSRRPGPAAAAGASSAATAPTLARLLDRLDRRRRRRARPDPGRQRRRPAGARRSRARRARAAGRLRDGAGLLRGGGRGRRPPRPGLAGRPGAAARRGPPGGPGRHRSSRRSNRAPAGPLRVWLEAAGIRLEKPVRLG